MRVLRLCVLSLLVVFTPAVFAQDVQMNQPDNFGTQDNSTTQSETNHAITPNAILAAWNDSTQIGTLGATAFQSFISWRVSTNGGTSFSGGGFFNPPANFQFLGDPAVVADSNGYFYIGSLASPSSLGGSLQDVAVARSTGNAAPFSFGSSAILSPITSGDFFDKELMAIDLSGGTYNDRIYIVATEFTGGGFGAQIVAAHSTSLSPLTFSSWQFISSASDVSTGAVPVVDQTTGNVYVIWTSNENTLRLVESTDGGGTFKNPDPADPAPSKTVATFNSLPFLNSLEGASSLKTADFSQLAIDATATGSPTRGYMYVTFAAMPTTSGTDQSDVFFTRSTDGGITWQAPRDISSGLAATIGQDTTTNDNWMPSITASPVNGHIYITYYDRRDDPANLKARVYRALSTDGGLTFANAALGASQFTPIVGFAQAGASNNYWGEYNWSTADANGLHFTWGDSHNTCNPPGGASSPCSPSGRPDLDPYYHQVANLSGADLFIQPWGAVTGIGPLWQTPDIFVVDSMGNPANAVKGVINNLHARVRNLGNAAASGVVVLLKYAPWFAGINDSMLKEIGTVTLNFSAAGGGSDTQIAAINWDLTNLADNNGGLWPAPISAFDHFCVKVWVQYPADINLSNNVAQNNFFNVMTASAPNAPFRFIIVAPEREREQIQLAQLQISKLPEGFRAAVTVQGVDDATKGFRLLPNEKRLAEVRFLRPPEFKSAHDVVADVTLLINGKPQGGVSALLYQSPEKKSDLNGIGAVTGPYWEVKRPRPIANHPGEPPQEERLPVRVIPANVKTRQTFEAAYEKVFSAITRALKDQKRGPAVANLERGLINTSSIKLTEAEVKERVAETEVRHVHGNGYAIVSFWLHPVEGKTEVGVGALIAVDDEGESPLGRVLHSNGSLERQLLQEVQRFLAAP